MNDDLRSLRDGLLRVITGRNLTDEEEEELSADGSPLNTVGIDAGMAKALISAIFARAGKSKDEVIQMVAREMGMAVAAMLKEPLAQLAKHQKLQISFEFVPKHGHEGERAAEPEPEPRARRPRRSRPVKRAATRKRSEHRTDS